MVGRLKSHEVEGLARSMAMAPLSADSVAKLLGSHVEISRHWAELEGFLVELAPAWAEVRRILNEVNSRYLERSPFGGAGTDLTARTAAGPPAARQAALRHASEHHFRGRRWPAGASSGLPQRSQVVGVM